MKAVKDLCFDDSKLWSSFSASEEHKIWSAIRMHIHKSEYWKAYGLGKDSILDNIALINEDIKSII